MGRPSMTQSQIDYSDVQGLVRFGYKRMTEASLRPLTHKGCWSCAILVRCRAGH